MNRRSVIVVFFFFFFFLFIYLFIWLVHSSSIIDIIMALFIKPVKFKHFQHGQDPFLLLRVSLINISVSFGVSSTSISTCDSMASAASERLAKLSCAVGSLSATECTSSSPNCFKPRFAVSLPQLSSDND